MPQKPELLDSTGHVADGALFTLAETCSGAAMAGGFASVILSVRPVAAQVEFEVLRPASGLVHAQAKVAQAISPLKQTLRTAGKINFPVEVEAKTLASNISKAPAIEVSCMPSMKACLAACNSPVCSTNGNCAADATAPPSVSCAARCTSLGQVGFSKVSIRAR
eukprot:gene57988-77383_t